MGDIIDFKTRKRKHNRKKAGISYRFRAAFYNPIFSICFASLLSIVSIVILKHYTIMAATYTIMVANAFIFFMVYSHRLSFINLGGSYDSIFNRKEYYRVISMAFTHQEVWHILMNMYSLNNLGEVLEPLLGTTRFIVYYLIIIVVGGTIVAKIHEKHNPYVYCIGASGVLCGLMGVYMVIVFMYMGVNGLRGCLPSLLCLLLMTFSKRIDSIGHFVGLGVGIVLAIITLFL